MFVWGSDDDSAGGGLTETTRGLEEGSQTVMASVGEKEALENMREILSLCRCPRHVLTTQWISTLKLYLQMDSPDAFRHIKVFYCR